MTSDPVDPPLEVCAGAGRSVREIAEALVRVSGAPRAIREAMEGPRAEAIVGNPAPLRAILGALAAPRIDFAWSIADLWSSIASSPNADLAR
ncbi:MAG: hypothetical protein FJ257_04505 [Phycisphaerae bacterium]|nr:hypothetical protein [Phycisphaerae bacterium]